MLAGPSQEPRPVWSKKLGCWRQKAKPQPFLVYFVQFVHTQIVKLLEKKNKRLLWPFFNYITIKLGHIFRIRPLSRLQAFLLGCFWGLQPKNRPVGNSGKKHVYTEVPLSQVCHWIEIVIGPGVALCWGVLKQVMYMMSLSQCCHWVRDITESEVSLSQECH